jgi:hypothetical protein
MSPKSSVTQIDSLVPWVLTPDIVLDCHVWSNDKVRVTARNVSLSTVDLRAAGLSVQVVKRKVG